MCLYVLIIIMHIIIIVFLVQCFTFSIIMHLTFFSCTLYFLLKGVCPLNIYVIYNKHKSRATKSLDRIGLTNIDLSVFTSRARSSLSDHVGPRYGVFFNRPVAGGWRDDSFITQIPHVWSRVYIIAYAAQV